MALRVTHHSIHLVGDETGADALDRLIITEGGFKGWDAAVNIRRPDLDRPFGHGSFPTVPLLGDRAITINGVATGVSSRNLTRVLDYLASWPRDYDWLYVTEHGRTLRARAGLQSITADRGTGRALRARFEAVLWCPEPWRFGATTDFILPVGGRGVLKQYGTVEAAPVVKVTGPITGTTLTITMNGVTWQLLGGVNAGETMTVDMRTGLVVSNTRGTRPAAGFGQLLRVPAGRAVDWAVAGTGTGRVTVAVTDTYI